MSGSIELERTLTDEPVPVDTRLLKTLNDTPSTVAKTTGSLRQKLREMMPNAEKSGQFTEIPEDEEEF